MKLTLKYKNLDNGRIFGQIAEIPEVLSEAANMQELKENIQEALELYREEYFLSSLKKIEGVYIDGYWSPF